jgi:hypothetical protein
MNTEGYDKTDDRQPQDGSDIETDQAEKPQEFGGFSSPGGEPVAELMLDAEDPAERRPGAPKKPARARKDALRNYAATLGAEPGELLLATIMQGLDKYLDGGGHLGDWMEARSAMMATNLHMKRSEAFKLLQKMLGDAMPYVHQKLPQLVDIEGGEIMFAMMMPDGSIQTGAAGGSGGMDLRPADVRQIASNNDKNQHQSDDDSRTEDGESQ